MAFALHNPAVGRTVGLCLDCGWKLVFACDAGHRGQWGRADLSAKFSRDVTLEAIAERLTCATCGLKTGGLALMQDDTSEGRSAAQRPDMGLPGAYEA